MESAVMPSGTLGIATWKIVGDVGDGDMGDGVVRVERATCRGRWPIIPWKSDGVGKVVVGEGVGGIGDGVVGVSVGNVDA